MYRLSGSSKKLYMYHVSHSLLCLVPHPDGSLTHQLSAQSYQTLPPFKTRLGQIITVMFRLLPGILRLFSVSPVPLHSIVNNYSDIFLYLWLDDLCFFLIWPSRFEQWKQKVRFSYLISLLRTVVRCIRYVPITESFFNFRYLLCHVFVSHEWFTYLAPVPLQ